MLNVEWSKGKVRVLACKGGPGYAYLAGRQPDQRGIVAFREVGIGMKSVICPWPVVKAVWIPMFGGHGQEVDLNLAIAKAEEKVGDTAGYALSPDGKWNTGRNYRSSTRDKA